MKKYYSRKTFAEVYYDILKAIIDKPEYISNPRGLEIKEITNLHFEIKNPIYSLYSNERRSSQFKYIAGELVWYFTGSNDLEFIEKFAKFWKNVANEDNTLNSAYGNLLFRTHHGVVQWKWAYDSLINDKDSRQAVLHFNMPNHQKINIKDFVCTMYGMFTIRNNKLNFTINMRSNDIILGLPTDIAFFCMLQQQMLKLLKETVYPDLELGTYTHIANSMHLYSKNYKLAEDMVKSKFEPIEFKIGNENLVNNEGVSNKHLNLLSNSITYGVTSIIPKINDNLINWIKDKIYN